MNKTSETLKNISLLWIGSLTGAGCAFFVQLILARKLGPEPFGTFASAMTTVAILIPLGGFGLSQFWLKIFGEEGWQGIRWLPSSFRFIGCSCILILTGIIAWGGIGPHDREMRFLLWILSLSLFGQVTIELVSAKLQLEERFVYLAFWQFLPHFLRLSILSGLAFIATEWMNTKNCAIAFASISIVFAISGGIQLFQMANGHFDLKGHEKKHEKSIRKPNIGSVIKNTWPFGLAGVFHLVYYQSDIVLVKYIIGSQAAGIYNVAFTIMTAMYLLPTVIFQKFLLPKTHRWANHNRERFYQVYRKGNLLMVVLGLIAMIGIWSCSFFIIPFLFGPEYTGAVFLLNILALCAPVYFLAISVGATLVTKDHMKKKVIFMGMVAILNLLLNLILIPRFGAAGAAVATLFSNLILLFIYFSFAQKVVFRDLRGIEGNAN